MKKVAICVPTWNRFDFTIKCFEQIINDERVEEFIINDDNSNDGSYERLVDFYKYNPKVKLFQNKERLKVHGNKAEAIKKSSAEWCILFDSDNVISKQYLDTIFSQEWNEDTIFQPSFAMPNFDYRHLEGVYNISNMSDRYEQPLFECMLNTQNFFVNREKYIETWEDQLDINGADSIFFNYLWLKKNNSIFVMPNLSYEHTVHRGSFYESVAEESLPKSVKIFQDIINLTK
jgi:glycosyltransferase involved in cell wall biosynthesis